MKVCFIFPNNSSARFTAAKLLETGFNVVFYCPETTDLDIAQNIIFELNIIGRDQNELREVSDSFETRKDDADLRDCDIIGRSFNCSPLPQTQGMSIC